MQASLIALFENSNIIQDGKLNINKIKKSTLSQLMDFCGQFSEITSYDNVKPETSIYSHSASVSLGGGRSPCRYIGCRLEKVYQLTQFAAFYSDKIYFNNFLYGYLLPGGHRGNDKKYVKGQIIEDLVVMSYLYPYIKSGNVLPVTFNNICPDCLVVTSAKGSTNDKYKKACKDLEKRYLNEIDYFLERKGDIYRIVMNGSEMLLPHGSVAVVYGKQFGGFRKIQDVLGKLKTGMKIPLSKRQVSLLAENKRFVEMIVRSVAFELGGSSNLRTSYLSDSEIEIKFIQELVDDPLARRRTMLMSKYLTCLVPFLEDVNPKDILKLRKDEHDHFILFRQALIQAIDEYKVIGDKFTERDAQALYSDVIQKKLSQLNNKVSRAKRHFQKDSRRKIIGWVGAISAGFLTGLVTSNFLAGSMAFGSVKAGAELIDGIMSKSDSEESIKDEDMYFLWRVKKLAE